jgi:hypothetical protein
VSKESIVGSEKRETANGKRETGVVSGFAHRSFSEGG